MYRQGVPEVRFLWGCIRSEGPAENVQVGGAKMFYNVELIDVDSGEILRYDMVHVNTFNNLVQFIDNRRSELYEAGQDTDVYLIQYAVS